MRRIKILFEPYYLYHLPQLMPLYELLKDDPRFDIYFSFNAEEQHEGERRNAVPYLQELGKPLILGDSESDRFRRLDEIGFDFQFIGWSRMGYIDHVVGREFPKIIMIYHGIGVKSSYYRDNHPRLDYRVVESPYREAQLRRHGFTGKTLLAGFMKLDPLYGSDGSAGRAALERLGLPAGRKTILYAPTFYPSSIGAVRHRIAEAAIGHNLVIKAHSYTMYRERYCRDRVVLEDIAAHYPHVRLLPETENNILDWFDAADLLITDASSVMFEYLPLDRPVIVLARHRLKWNHRLLYPLYLLGKIDLETRRYDGFFHTCRNYRRLGALISRCLGNPGELSEQRCRTAKELLHFSDGRCAARMKELFEGVLAENGF